MRGEEVVLRNGDVHAATRASMSIPGVICPVERDGKVLVYRADKRVGLVDTQALTHLACLWHAVNHEEDEEIDEGEILRRINALYREASLSQALSRWKRRDMEMIRFGECSRIRQ